MTPGSESSDTSPRATTLSADGTSDTTAVPPRLAGSRIAIVVAVTPVAAYCLALCQEIGFFSVLNIPFSLARIDLFHLVPVMFILVAAATAVFAWVSFAWTTFKKYSRFLGTLIPGLVYFLILVLLHPSRPKEWLVFAALFVWMELAYLLPALRRRPGQSFQERYDENAIKAGEPTFWQSPSLSRQGYQLIMAVVGVVLLGNLCISYGKHEAYDTVEYLTIDNLPRETVVLRLYANSVALTGSVDTTTKHLTGHFAYVSLVGPPGYTLKLSRIGPILPVRTQATEPTGVNSASRPRILPWNPVDTADGD